MAGIIIPVAIHFWNTREGKAFPIGSIMLLEKSIKQYTRTLRITEWLLLLLRCIIIILLSMLLAKPVWKQSFTRQNGWILLDKQNIKAVYNHFKPTVDSLLSQGCTFHYFEEGFQQATLKEALESGDTSEN